MSGGTVRPRDARPPWPLTARETEVLAEMASGKTNAAIAQVLFISRRSVEKHVNSIFSKLLLPGRDEHHPRVQAVLTYLAHTRPSDVTTWAVVPPGVAPVQPGRPGPERHSWTQAGVRPRHRHLHRSRVPGAAAIAPNGG